MAEKKKKLSREERKELLKQIEKEIAIFKGDTTFLPDEYRKWRLKGLKPSEIDYDMCHVWR